MQHSSGQFDSVTPSTLSVTFWGVRGSIAAPGRSTNRVGGNTSCLEVRAGGARIILDGGTGLRQLGLAAAAAVAPGTPLEAVVLFSHLHWDHIQGVPFLPQLFSPTSRLRFVGPAGLTAALELQMSRPTFPVALGQLPAPPRLEELAARASFQLGPVEVTTHPLRHPGGAIGYRLTLDGYSVTYACDHEHPEGPDRELAEFAFGTDLLVYDAQYLPAEYPTRRGWGHSTWERGAELARLAQVGQLALTHHDPLRSDRAVAELEREARQRFPRTVAAREGLHLTFPATARLRSSAA